MYYNIKIKSNGSEFSLESNNKEVTQREMDIYFSHIFDVSEEFKSKIKKIEIVNTNVKSINEIEKLTPNNQKEASKAVLFEEEIEKMANLKAQKIIEEKIQQQQEEEKKALELAKQQEEERKKQELIKQQEQRAKEEEYAKKQAQELARLQVEQMQKRAQELARQQEEQALLLEKQKEQAITNSLPSETITFQNEPSISPKPTVVEQPRQVEAPIQTQKQEIETKDFIIEETNQAPEIQSDIDELINLAQEKLEIKQTSHNDDIYLNFSKDNMEDLSIIPDVRIEESQIEQHYQSKLDDIFNSTPDFSQEPQVQTPTMAPDYELEEILTTIAQEISQIEELPINIEEMSVSIQEETTKTQEEVIQVQEKQTTIPQQEIIKNPEYNYLPEDDEDEKQDVQETNPTQAPAPTPTVELDFKPFLAGFACSEIIDEFLICAYFIKNVLRKSEFTIKFINSKLFQATGKIANLSILDELISREYIKTIDTDEGKKYSITMDGESYFAEKFQG